MRIEELKLIPPSKRSSAVLIEFMKEHEKGLKAIKALTEIKEIAENYTNNCDFSRECDKCNYSCFGKDILQKISKCEGNDE